MPLRISPNHATLDLILLDALEQSLEIALPEALIAFALDELEEDRPDDVLREDLQQNFGLGTLDDTLTVDQQAEVAQPVDRLAMVGQALVDLVVVNVRWRSTLALFAEQMSRCPFDLDGAKPAGADDLGQAMGVVTGPRWQ